MENQVDKPQLVTLQAEIPQALFLQANWLVEEGRYQTIDDLVLDALRHLLTTYRTEVTDQFIREDVEWGLSGSDQ